MSLKKLGPAKWRVMVSVRDKNKGYPISKQVTVVGSRSEAVLAEADILAKLRAQVSSLKTVSVSTFGDAITLYRERLHATGKESHSHMRSVDYIQREFGHIPLVELPDRFESYLRVMMASQTRFGKKHTGAMSNRLIVVVKAVFNRLVDLELIDRNPITKVRFPMLKLRARDNYLSPEERLRLYSAIQETRPEFLPLVMYMMVVPCRVSELTTARREQYSPINNTIYIPDSKTGVPMYKPVPEEMRGYFISIPDDCPWLFYKTVNGKYEPWHSYRNAWDAVLRKAGIAKLHVHDLRHISATDLLTAGNPERVIMEIAGWNSPMLSTYYHKNSLVAAQTIRFGREPLQNHYKPLQNRYKACNSM